MIHPSIYVLGIWYFATLAWWLFAFLPVPADTIEWLATARNVCFGTLENGLPGPSGWILLIIAPLSFLTAIVVGWNRDLKVGFKSFIRHPAAKGIALILAATTLFVASWVGNKIQTGKAIQSTRFESIQEGDLPGHYPRKTEKAPDFSLIDQHGQSVSLDDFKGQTLLLTFAFAHCQTVCPAIVHQSLEALQQTRPGSVSLLIVTLDPWRDTPKSLPFLASKWKLPENAHVLSGSIPEVTRVLDAYKIPWKRDEKNGDISHPALTYVINAQRELMYTFNNAPSRWLVQATDR